MRDNSTHPLERAADKFDEESNTVVNRRSFFTTIGNILKTLDRTPDHKAFAFRYEETAREMVLLILANIIFSMVMKGFGIRMGNAYANITDERTGIERALERNGVISTYIDVAVIAPLIEETIFRYAPSLFHKADGSKQWKTGIPVSLVFAGLHNVTIHGINTEYIPIPQFTSGLFFWYLMREKGFSHSVLAHAENNTAAFIAASLLYTYPSAQ